MGWVKEWWKSPRVRSIRRRISNLQVHFFPLLGVMIRMWVWLVNKCVTYDIRGPLNDFIKNDRPCIMALWHQSVFLLMFELFRFTPKYPSLFMVSKGRIGTIGAYFLNLYGIECVSTGVGKKEIVYELAKRANETGRSIFLMADGSKGPQREAKWGAIYLARETGLPLIAAHAWGDNIIILKRTWMKLALPKLWGHSTIFSAEPLYIPKTEDKIALELYRKELETRLNTIADVLVDDYKYGK